MYRVCICNDCPIHGTPKVAQTFIDGETYTVLAQTWNNDTVYDEEKE